MKRFAVLVVLALFFLFLTRGVAPSMSSTRVYRVARDTTWYPLAARGKEKNIQAFTDELMARVAEEEGVKIQQITAPWDTHLALLERNSCDAVITSLLPTNRLQDRFAFSESILLLGPVIVVPVDSMVASLDDLQKMTLGVRDGASFAYGFPQNSSVVVKMYITESKALDDLVDGEIQAVIMDRLSALQSVEGFYRGQLKVAGDPLNQAGLRIMTMKDQRADFAENVDASIKDFKRTGLYDKLLKKWAVLN